ncbi:carboxypeptidase-like regulatory domain-containing protein [Natrarchaeobius oligotrophus]|uniref:Carboxypeptidase regulatory-like domain-containing protein n=1 Tax=Natrarchaeobius chitinivorans TaxID=1679083 RepID=A0A3N6N133_NATCH|nr:carboxypeptidase-like regulatory domain-containing protein [Natrarchaeobius chitinivorans]RQH02562.1 carboxypeptidase regulatory-like domain-containing protein [Natrarchaeobius chitinivorans]
MKRITEPIRQIGLLVGGTLTLRRLLLHRVTILLVVTLVLAGGTMIYVNANNDGTISGQVVGPDGEPVEDATVHIWPIHLQSVQQERTTTTDANGEFEFTDQTDLLEFRIQASHDDLGTSEERHEHLYFEGQNVEIELEITDD